MKRLHMVGLGILLVGCDQLSKALLYEKRIQAGETIFINKDSSFVVGVLTLLALATIFYLTKKEVSKEESSNLKIPLMIIVAGGVSNLADICFREGVIDPFRIHELFFNLADIYILAGVIAVVKILSKKYFSRTSFSS